MYVATYRLFWKGNEYYLEGSDGGGRVAEEESVTTRSGGSTTTTIDKFFGSVNKFFTSFNATMIGNSTFMGLSLV